MFFTIRLHFTVKCSSQVKPHLVILILADVIVRRFSVKQVFLKTSQYSQEYTCTVGVQFYYQRDSDTGVFL